MIAMLLKRIQHSPLFLALLLGHIVYAGVFLLQHQGLLQSAELYSYDWLFPSRAMAKTQQAAPITMVWLEDEDQRLFGWPITDRDLLRLLKKLQSVSPSVIGLDVYRDAPVPLGNPHYRDLVQFISQHQNIVLIKKFYNEQGSGYVQALPEINSQQISFNDLPTDAGSIIRRGLLYIGDEKGNVLESFSMKLARYYLFFKHGISPQADPDNAGQLLLGQQSLAPLPPDFGGYVAGDMAGFQLMLTYPNAPTPFAQVNLRTLLSGDIDPALFKDRIIIIGVKAEATPDFLFTPYSRWLKDDDRVAGAEIHAYIVSQLLHVASSQQALWHSWPQHYQWFWLWLWCLIGALVCLWSHSVWQLIGFIVFGISIMAGVSYWGVKHLFWLPSVAPALGWITALLSMNFYLVFREKSQRNTLMQLFSSHVSREVASVIWQEREQFLRNGRLFSQRLTATVLFTDLQNFTTVSEKMEPQALMEWLNHYMASMVKVIELYHGQVNKFIGDAIMAVYGIPIPRTTEAEIQRDAINAVECALHMRAEIEHLRQEWRQQGLPQIRMRIGIFTGSVIAGSLGGIERQEYTVIGDTVNTASRLESFDKSIEQNSVCRILIGESTAQYLPERFVLERVGGVHLKGKATEVVVYSVVGQTTV